MKKVIFLLLAATVLAWSAAAQTGAPDSPSPGAAAPSQATPSSQSPDKSQQQQQGVPVTGQPAGQNRNPQRGEDVGQQDKGVPVEGQSQSAVNAQAGSENALAPNTALVATLSKTVEAKKAKEGDQVTAKVAQDVISQGNVVIPRGARLIGHITTVKPAAKGDNQSQLGIGWDHAELKNGSQVPLHAIVVALAPPPEGSQPMPSGMSPDTGPMGEAGPQGGVGAGSQGGTAGTVGNPGGSPPSAPGIPGGIGAPAGNAPSAPASAGRSGPVLSPRSVGVVGIQGVTIANSPQGSVISDKNGNLKLQSGTQLVLRVVNQ